MDPKTRDLVWGLGSAAAIVIGSLGPWATFGPFSVSGTNGDGVITLILGLVAVALILAARWMWVVVAAGVISALVGIIDTIDVSSSGELLSPSPGWGVIVVAIAGVSLTVWSVRAARTRRPRRSEGVMPGAAPTAPPPHRVDQP